MIEASFAMEPAEANQSSMDLLSAGETLFEAGDILRAEDCFVQSARQNPECADSWSNLGVVLFHLERPIESRCAFERALGLNPQHEAASEGLSLLEGESETETNNLEIPESIPAPSIEPEYTPERDLSLLPGFTDADQFAEHFGRALWLLGPHASEIRSLHIAVSDDIDTQSPNWPQWMDAKVEQVFDFLKPRITWHRAEQISEAIQASPHSLVWSKSGMEAHYGLLRAFGVSQHTIDKRCLDIDPIAHRHSLHAAPILMHRLFGEPRTYALTQEAEKRLANAIDHLGAEGRDLQDWQLLGGGPSVRDIDWSDQSNAIRVVCNRFLEDEALTEQVAPSFLAIMDAGYVGCSQAGADWRQRVVNWISQDLNRYILTMDRFGPWIENALPQYLKSRVIALPNQSVGLPMSTWHGDLNQQFWLPDAHNVMTSVCLPVAATFAKSITIFGMDGSSPTQGYVSYGTAYSPEESANQGDSFMDAWYAAHPRIEEDQYSKTYRDNLNASIDTIINHLERDRGIIISAGTPSHIPALAERHHLMR